MKKLGFFLLLLFAGSFILLTDESKVSAITTNPIDYSDSFIRGADISILADMESAGAKYYENGTQKDALKILKDNGVNYVRLRIWNDPYDANGNSYGAGTNDLDTTIALAQRAKSNGLKVLLDFHYSDFWVDPGKQNLPKSWLGLTFNDLNTNIYNYTHDVLTEMKNNNVYPDMIQIGNELNSGMLWPYGKSWGEGGGEFDRLASFLESGVQAVKDTETQDTKIMLHLADGGNYETFKWWFDEITARSVDYDIIGVSYYPYWHGTLDQLETNINNISTRYNKEVIVVETAYGYTTANADAKENAFGSEEATVAGYPATAQGQYDFLSDLVKSIQNVPNDKGTGFFYWEPLWYNGDVSWATQAGMDYLGVTDETGNEWDNQAMFDSNGNVLDSIKVYHDSNSGNTVNYVSNPSFESDSATSSPSYWTKWLQTGTVSSTIKTETGALDGSYKLSFWNSNAYEGSIFQTVSELSNGTYTLTAWVIGGGTHDIAQMYAKNYGGSAKNQNITISSAMWNKVTIKNIEVTNGTCEIGFYNKGQAAAWLNIDNVKLIKN